MSTISLEKGYAGMISIGPYSVLVFSPARP
jgi:hypothetical protein